MKYDFLIVGAGYSGAILAERIATQLDKKVLLIDKRNHIAGNAYDETDEFGIIIHRYGPHIFHTNDEEVFTYLSQFTKWKNFEHKVLANYKGKFYNIPINRKTINKLYNKNIKTENEVINYFDSVKEKISEINNSEDIIINQVGRDLFEIFFKTYTKKQWNIEAKELSPSVCGRIPIYFNDDEKYFKDKYQFIPIEGYTKLFERMINNKNIELLLNTEYKQVIDQVKFNKLIYTGQIDYYFDYVHGKLPYRSIDFEYKHYEVEYFQSTAQVNYVDKSRPFTRIVEHKYFLDQKLDSTTISVEYPNFDGEPYYPIPTEKNLELFEKYKMESEKYKNVIMCGRLADYKYYNMDQVVKHALQIFREKIIC